MANWPDDSDVTPPDSDGSNVVFWMAAAFVAVIVSALIVRSCCA